MPTQLVPAKLCSCLLATGETGTYQYMAPEVFRHEEYDCKADVWSWAVLCVELVRCQRPYEELYLLPAQIALGVAGGEYVGSGGSCG